LRKKARLKTSPRGLDGQKRGKQPSIRISSVSSPFQRQIVPDPGSDVRLDEQFNFLRRQRETSQVQTDERLPRIERKLPTKIFVGEQPVDDESDSLL
jgi:hypothetical protein